MVVHKEQVASKLIKSTIYTIDITSAKQSSETRFYIYDCIRN